MTVGSATWHGPKNCLLTNACLGDPLQGAGASAEAVGDGNYRAMREDGKDAADEASKAGDQGDALGKQ